MLNFYGDFLGTMAGNQLYRKDDQSVSYSREYESFGPSDKLRKSISKVGQKGWLELGQDYGFAPSTMQGGGYFVSKNCEFSKKHLNCFDYALSTFGTLNMHEVRQMHIDDVISTYFNRVIEPQDGDLAIYSVPPGRSISFGKGQISSGTTHAGIYRKTTPNWRSPEGGTIESK